MLGASEGHNTDVAAAEEIGKEATIIRFDGDGCILRNLAVLHTTFMTAMLWWSYAMSDVDCRGSNRKLSRCKLVWRHISFQSQKPWKTSWHLVQKTRCGPLETVSDLRKGPHRVVSEFSAKSFYRGLEALDRDLRWDLLCFSVVRSTTYVDEFLPMLADIVTLEDEMPWAKLRNVWDPFKEKTVALKEKTVALFRPPPPTTSGGFGIDVELDDDADSASSEEQPKPEDGPVDDEPVQLSAGDETTCGGDGNAAEDNAYLGNIEEDLQQYEYLLQVGADGAILGGEGAVEENP
jgi:hypothetical protein